MHFWGDFLTGVFTILNVRLEEMPKWPNVNFYVWHYLFFWTTYQLYSAWTLPYSKLFFFSPFVAHYFATYLKFLIIHIFIIIIFLNKGNQTLWIASGSCGSLLPHKLLSFWHNLSTAIHKTHKCPTEPLG